MGGMEDKFCFIERTVCTYHFNNFHLSLDSQVIQEHLQVFFDLNRVVLHLGDGEDTHLAVLPRAMLFQQERQQHQQATIVDDPPDVNVSGDLYLHMRARKGE